MKKLLLISNSTNAGEVYLDWCSEMIKDFCERHGVKRVLFVPYAGVKVAYKNFAVGYEAYTERVKEKFASLGIDLYSIHRENDIEAAIEQAECVAVGGGNTFSLVKAMQENGSMNLIAKRAEQGMPYMGWSAGANIASPTLMTTNDMPVAQPLSFKCMALVPFQINPHYTDFFDPKHGGETRDDRLNEFIEVNKDVTVAGIREATALNLENGKLRLIGRNNKMKIFKYGKEPQEYSIDDDINFLIK